MYSLAGNAALAYRTDGTMGESVDIVPLAVTEEEFFYL